MKNRLKNSLIISLLFAYTVSFVFPAGISQIFVPVAVAASPENTESVFDLFAVVVDDEMLSSADLEDKITRYMDDIVSHNDNLNAKMLKYNKESDDESTIIEALTNLYFNQRLVGAVFVGDIPLPTLPGGEVSMLPYTDFVDKKYIFDKATKTFSDNPNNKEILPEIWSGVLIDSSAQKISDYFDKNHEYYENGESLPDSEKKLFFADLINEAKETSSTKFENYQNYLKYAEDEAFQRYTSSWAKALSEKVQSDISGVLTEEAKLNLSSADISNVPDIQSKNIIDKYLLNYARAFSKFVSEMNDFLSYTGRYDTLDTDSPVKAITVKDEFSRRYLKESTVLLEEKINEVAEKIADKLQINEYSELSGKIGSESFRIGLFNDKLIYRFNYVDEMTGMSYVNGTKVDDIEYALDCSLNAGSSNYTTANRAENISTASRTATLGVLNKMISPQEAKSKYGIEMAGAEVLGFERSYLMKYTDGYKNPLEGKILPGDLIVAVNGHPIGSTLSFDNAIQKSYDKVFSIMQKVNDGKGEDLSESDKNMLLIHSEHSLKNTNAKVIMGNIGIEFYRNGTKYAKNFTFSLDKKGSVNTEDPQGTPAIIVLLSKLGYENATPDFDKDGDGALFLMNDVSIGYDETMGCNFANAKENPERCFNMVAQLPVRDLAGAVSVSAPSDIDNEILNSCYFGLPTIYSLENDGNPYLNVRYPSSKEPFVSSKSMDLYGDFMRAIGDFVSGGNSKKPEVSAINVYNSINDFDASKVILNTSGDTVTLKDFSDYAGLDPKNMKEIARKLLSKDGSFVVPADANRFGKEIILNVKTKKLKEVSSLIPHTEPTTETIAKQVQSGASRNIPIDDPRYLAFEISGEQQKILYPNLFETNTFDELKDTLLSTANTLSKLKNSHKIFGEDAKAESFTQEQIRDEIFKYYLYPLVSGDNQILLSDILAWNNMNLSDKHKYVLSSNLKASNYEAVYLMLDGKDNFFDINFPENDLPEDDARFENIEPGESISTSTGMSSVALSGEAKKSNEFVPLSEFFDEISKFIDSFTTVPKFEDCCGYAAGQKSDSLDLSGEVSEFGGVDDDSLNEGGETIENTSGNISVSVDKDFVSAQTREEVVLSVNTEKDSELVEYVISGASSALTAISSSNAVSVKKVATFRFRTNGNSGEVLLSARVPGSDIQSNKVRLNVSGKDLKINTYIANEAILDDEFYNDLVEMYAAPLNEPVTDVGEGLIRGDVVDEGTFTSEDDLGEVGIDGGTSETVSTSEEEATVSGTDIGSDSGSDSGSNIGPDSGSDSGSNIGSNIGPDSTTKKPSALGIMDTASKYIVLLSTNVGRVLKKIKRGNVSEEEENKPLIQRNAETVPHVTDENDSSSTLDSTWQRYYYDNYLEARAYNLFASIATDSFIAFVPDSENPFINSENISIESANSMRADGSSLMKIDIVIYGEDGNIDKISGEKIRVRAENSLVTFENGNTADSVDGVASFLIRAGKVSGIETITAESVSKKYPMRSTQIILKSGDAETFSATSNSDSTFEGAKIEISFKAFDKNGNIANNGPSKFGYLNGEEIEYIETLSGEAEMTLENPSESVYVFLVDSVLDSLILKNEGFSKVDILRGEFMGRKFPSKVLSFKDAGKINISPVRTGNNLSFSLVSEKGFTVKYQGVAEVKTASPDIILFENNGSGVSMIRPEIKDGSTVSPISLISSGKSGSAKINISVDGVSSLVYDLSVAPGSANQIELKTSSDVLYDSLLLSAVLKDQYGNISTNDNTSSVEFSFSDATKDLAEFEGAATVKAKNGSAGVQIKSKGKTGTLNIIAKSGEIESIISVQIKSRIFASEFAKTGINAPFVSLNGGSFGNPKVTDNMAAELVFSDSKVLSVSTLSFGEERDLGYGFQDANKHMLYYAGGNNAGVSTISLGSVNAIVWGDPAIKIKDSFKSLQNFDNTVGKRVSYSNKTVKDLVEMDFDGDLKKDILAIYEDGYVRWFQKVDSFSKFSDRGNILFVANEIYSATALDYDNDGLTDLIVGTKEVCEVGEDCLSLFKNTGGGFERTRLDLNISGRAFKMKSVDLNLDSCTDLVVSDSAGNIRMFYNDCINGLNESFSNSYNFGLTINPEINVAESLFANISGSDENKAIDLVTAGKKEKYFPLSDISVLKNSKKFAQDVNGDTLNINDKIKYTISLVNSGASVISNLSLSDIFNPGMTLDTSSLNVSGLSFERSGTTGREYIIKGIEIPANSSLTITYEMTISSMPETDFDVGRSLFDYPFKDDAYPDIVVRPKINKNGKLKFIYSKDTLNSDNTVAYGYIEKDRISSSEETEISYNEASEEDLEELYSSIQVDSDFDGIYDYFDTSNDSNNSSLENIIGGVADAISNVLNVAEDVGNLMQDLRCGGAGCIPTPYNYAFFAPDVTSNNNGMALFSLITYPPYITTGVSAFTDPGSYFRPYLSPTLSGGLGAAVCAGPGPSGMCFAYALPVEALGLCPDIFNDAMEAFSSAAKSIVSEAGLTTLVMDGTMEDAPDDLSTSGNYINPDLEFSAAYDVNIKIPGFPSVVTDWLDAQTDEIFNKLLDLPDLYFIYPDISTMFSDSITAGTDYSKISSLNDLLRAINSIPLIDIQSKDIVLKIPAISEAEIIKWQRQAYLWLEYEKKQLEKIKNNWACDMDDVRKNMCDTITLKLGNITASIEATLAKLDMLLNLPAQILTWKTMEAKYATQIICYLDAIMSYTGGYLKKQSRIIESWMAAIENLIRTIKDFKVILDLSIDYQASCDECKNDRFSEIGLLLGLFAEIPKPPVVEFPKWPDIIFDMSQVKAGVEIVWPNLIFKPEKITLPDIPTITLPDVFPIIPPHINIDLDDFGLGDIEELKLPDWIENFPDFGLSGILNLPDLPPLPLPNLPDLPRPPKIPSIENAVLDFVTSIKPIFTILCLLKTGLIPVPEGALKNEIETLTQPSVTATLPFMMNLGINTPSFEYDFYEQIRLIAKIDFGIETDFIYNLVNGGAGIYNGVVENFVDSINKFTGIPLQNLVNNLVNALTQEAIRELNSAANSVVRDAEEAVQSSVDQASEKVEQTLDDSLSMELNNYLREKSEKLNIALSNVKKEIDEIDIPEKYDLVASSIYLDPSHPLLNRSIDEVRENQYSEKFKNYENLKDQLIAFVDNVNLLENNLNLRSLIANDTNSSKLVAQTINDAGVAQKIASGKMLLSLEAETSPSSPSSSSSGGNVNNTKGVFVVENGQAGDIFNYTKGIDSNLFLAYSDADILIHSKGEILLKENHSKSSSNEKGQVLSDSDLTDLAGKNTVAGFINLETDNKLTRASFLPYENAESYIVELRKNYFGNTSQTIYLDKDTHNFDMNLENGNFFAQVFAVINNEKISLNGESIVVSPQTCADKEAPLSSITSTNYDIFIFDTLEIDASASFDPNGEIKEIYVEAKPYYSDKETTNLPIKMYPEDTSIPVIKIGPFEKAGDIGKRDFVLHVVDQSGNSSKIEFSVNVSAPEISLDEKVSETKRILGQIYDTDFEVPFSVYRKRLQYRSDEDSLLAFEDISILRSDLSSINGNYLIDDLDLENMILIENSKGEIIAKIDPQTGIVSELMNGYSIVVSPATSERGTKIEIIDAMGKVYAEIYPIADSNIDTTLYYTGLPGVNLVDKIFDDNYQAEKFSNDDPIFFGASRVKNSETKKDALIVDSGANIYVLEEDISLRMKNDEINMDHLIIEVVKDNDTLFEISIKVDNASTNIIARKDLPFKTPYNIDKNSIIPDNRLFKDISPELKNIISYLYDKDIILGREVNGEIVFNPQEIVGRAEAVQTILKMLCINPRPEAYLAPSVFSDISHSTSDLPWYYAFVKEGFIRGIVEGYLGEIDEKSGKAPFKPLQAISRIEIAKIVLRTLEMQNIIKLGEVKIAPPGWWGNYLIIAQNFSKYLYEGSLLKNSYLISKEEALSAEKPMTREDLMYLASRVLDTHNCFETDEDLDGVKDYCKEKYSFSDNNADSDSDGLTNAEECKYGTNPYNADSDSDGYKDGLEIDKGVDPLNSSSFPMPDYEGIPSIPGIYIVPASCDTCPCHSSLIQSADVLPGDIFFTVISTNDQKHIFNKSNEN